MEFSVPWNRIFYFMAGDANVFLVRFSIDINLDIVETTFSHLTVMQRVQTWRFSISVTSEMNVHNFLFYDNGYALQWKESFLFYKVKTIIKSPNCRINMHNSFESRCISHYCYNCFAWKIDIWNPIFRIGLNGNNNHFLSILVSFLFFS